MLDDTEKKDDTVSETEVDETQDEKAAWEEDFDKIMQDAETSDDEVVADDDDKSGDAGDDDSPAGEDDVLSVLGWDKETLSAIEKLNPKILEDVKALIGKTSVASDDDAEAAAKAKEDAEKLAKAEKAKASKVAITPEELKVAKEKFGDDAFGIIEKLLNHTQSLEDQLSSVTSERQAEIEATKDSELVLDFRNANKKMDELAKDFPILGSSDKLPKDATGKLDDRNRSVRERATIWNHAEALRTAGLASTFSEALEEAVHWYRGKNGENLAMRKVVTDLNKNAKKFTPRPTHKHTRGKELDQKTAEGKAATMDEIFKEVGIED